MWEQWEGCVCACMYVRGYKGCGTCAWRATNNSAAPLLKVLSGSRRKPLTWKRCLIYSNSWEVLCVVPVSNERGRTNSWKGIFFPPQLCLQLHLTKGVGWSCMEQFAVGRLLRELQTTATQDSAVIRSKQISVLYFHLEDKTGTSEIVPLSFAVYL